MNNRGTILVVTLWIVSILALFAVGLGYRMGLLLKASGYRRDVKVVRQAATAGLAWASARLMSDSRATDNLYECGLVLDRDTEHDEAFGDIGVGGSFFTISYREHVGDKVLTRFGFQDEERRVDLNRAPYEMLSELPGVGSELASAIIDWRDENVDPLLDDAGNEKVLGAEDDAYEELNYACKDAPFQAIEELRLVKGMTEETYAQISPFVTVYGDGKVNINTASREVLRIVAHASLDQVGASTRDIDHLIDQIVDRRDGFDDEEGTDDDEPFINIGTEINQLLLGTEERRLARHMAEHYLVTASRFFRVAVQGRSFHPERVYHIEAVIERPQGGRLEKQNLIIRQWQEG